MDYLIVFFEVDLEEFLIVQQILWIDVVGMFYFVVVVGFNVQCVFFELLMVGVMYFEMVVDIVGVQQFVFFDVDGENLIGVDMVFGDYIFWLIVVYIDFGGQGNKVVFGDYLMGWMQVVVVEYVDCVVVVGYYQVGGVVLWFYVYGVIFVEGVQICVYGFYVLLGWWYYYVYCVEQVYVVGNQYFQYVVYV